MSREGAAVRSVFILPTQPSTHPQAGSTVLCGLERGMGAQQVSGQREADRWMDGGRAVCRPREQEGTRPGGRGDASRVDLKQTGVFLGRGRREGPEGGTAEQRSRVAWRGEPG